MVVDDQEQLMRALHDEHAAALWTYCLHLTQRDTGRAQDVCQETLLRAKVGAGEIGEGGDRLHPIAVARSVVIAQASAWVGALVLGWWIGVLAYLLPRRGELRVAADDTAGAVVAAVCALALVAAALWLQHSCKSPPQDPQDPAGSAGKPGETAPE